jgi:methyl-accepting chemotaxis protein
LKLLEKRAQAAREAALRQPPSRRDEPARATPARTPASHATSARSGGHPAPQAARSRTSAVRRAQIALVLLTAAAAGLLAFEAVPVAVPVGLLCALVGASLVLGHTLIGPLATLADTARAVTLGDHGTRAAAGQAGEFAEIARALNTLLDDRAAMVAQNSEQQQRLHNDIHHLTTVVAAAAAGDLSPRAPVQSGSLSKLAEELNGVVDTQTQLVHCVRSSAATLVETLTQCEKLTEQLSRGAARQGSGLEATAGALRAAAERTDSVASSARVAGDASRRTTETAREGGRLLERVREGLLQMRRGAQGSTAKMKRLGERATEVSAIVGAISRLSAQTNMLALNAAIEASRAGEHGLGFTVVADEVRKLAEDCEASTREIARLISAIQAETNEAIAEMERHSTQVEQNTQVATEAGGALDRILAVSQQGAQLVAEIGRSAQQQADESGGLRETVQATCQLSRDLQAVAERTQQAVNALSATATELQRRGAAFRDGGAVGETAPA